MTARVCVNERKSDHAPSSTPVLSNNTTYRSPFGSDSDSSDDDENYLETPLESGPPSPLLCSAHNLQSSDSFEDDDDLCDLSQPGNVEGTGNDNFFRGDGDQAGKDVKTLANRPLKTSKLSEKLGSRSNHSIHVNAARLRDSTKEAMKRSQSAKPVKNYVALNKLLLKPVPNRIYLSSATSGLPPKLLPDYFEHVRLGSNVRPFSMDRGSADGNFERRVKSARSWSTNHSGSDSATGRKTRDQGRPTRRTVDPRYIMLPNEAACCARKTHQTGKPTAVQDSNYKSKFEDELDADLEDQPPDGPSCPRPLRSLTDVTTCDDFENKEINTNGLEPNRLDSSVFQSTLSQKQTPLGKVKNSHEVESIPNETKASLAQEIWSDHFTNKTNLLMQSLKFGKLDSPYDPKPLKCREKIKKGHPETNEENVKGKSSPTKIKRTQSQTATNKKNVAKLNTHSDIQNIYGDTSLETGKEPIHKKLIKSPPNFKPVRPKSGNKPVKKSPSKPKDCNLEFLRNLLGTITPELDGEPSVRRSGGNVRNMKAQLAPRYVQNIRKLKQIDVSDLPTQKLEVRPVLSRSSVKAADLRRKMLSASVNRPKTGESRGRPVVRSKSYFSIFDQNSCTDLEKAKFLHLMIDQMVCEYKGIPLPKASRKQLKHLTSASTEPKTKASTMLKSKSTNKTLAKMSSRSSSKCSTYRQKPCPVSASISTISMKSPGSFLPKVTRARGSQLPLQSPRSVKTPQITSRSIRSTSTPAASARKSRFYTSTPTKSSGLKSKGKMLYSPSIVNSPGSYASQKLMKQKRRVSESDSASVASSTFSGDTISRLQEVSKRLEKEGVLDNTKLDHLKAMQEFYPFNMTPKHGGPNLEKATKLACQDIRNKLRRLGSENHTAKI